MPILETGACVAASAVPQSSDRVRSEALIGTNEAALAQGRHCHRAPVERHQDESDHARGLA